MERVGRRVEDLEVFRRAYRLSLEVHRASLEFPRIEQFGAGGSDPPGVEIDLRQPGRGVWPAGLVEAGVPPLSDDGDGFGRRDAGMDALLPAISAISEPRWPSAGGASTGRSPGCCRACSRTASDI